MVYFGPSGNDVKFYEDGNKSSLDAPRWLQNLGLNAYEISFGRGIRMTEKTAEILGKQAAQFGVKLSVHAPYYINLANPDAFEKNYHYIKRSLELLRIMGGNRLVIHTGSQMTMPREIALENCRCGLAEVVKRLQADGFNDYFLCIETMGKYAQIGNIDEICDLCRVGPHIIPTVDFGHLNCLAQGDLDIPYIFAKLQNFSHAHFHISFIEYGLKGEIRHVTLADQAWRFDVAQIIQRIKQRQADDVVICESASVMAQDAVKLMEFYLQ